MDANLEHVFDSLLDLVAVIDSEHRIRWVNQALAERLGVTQAECVGKMCYESMHGSDRPPKACPHRAFQAGRSAHRMEIYEERLNGHFLVNSAPLSNGESECVVHLMHNITERKEAEQALRESEQRYRLLAENTYDMIWMCDLNLRMQFISPSVTRLRGFTPEEVMTQSLDDILTPESAGVAQQALTEQLAAVEENPEVLAQPRRLELEQKCKDGSTIWTELTVTFLTEKGVPSGLIGITRDISERRAAEEAVRKEQELLRQLVESQERERKVFAYDIHDGLAQKLVGARMRLESFTEKYRDKREVSEQLLAEISDLLAESVQEARRLISGLRPPILDETDIVGAIEYLVQECQNQHSQKIDFQHELPSREIAPALEIAAFRIVQEALTNACRHSRCQRVQVKFTTSNGAMRIDIADDGVGFDPNAVEHEHFGLQSIRERARLLGGSAMIETSEATGTQIAVLLPLAD